MSLDKTVMPVKTYAWSSSSKGPPVSWGMSESDNWNRFLSGYVDRGELEAIEPMSPESCSEHENQSLPLCQIRKICRR